MASNSSSVSPFRIVLLVSTTLQLIVYVGAVLYSLLVGTIDLALPLKSAFLTAVAIPLYFTSVSLKQSQEARRINPDKFYEALLTFILDLAGTSLLVYYAIPTLFRTFSSVNLTGVDVSVKVFSSFSVVLMLVFLGLTIYETVSLKRRGKVPDALIPKGEEAK